MRKEELRKILIANKLKVTPQRVAILEALTELHNHPTADNIIKYIKEKHPNVAIGTVYNNLEVLIEKGIINKVNTDKDITRYDAITANHHHLYCVESERIEDYFDDKLNQMIRDYLRRENIPNFEIRDIKLQIIGKFLNKK